jgi:hypothetical protein
MFGIFKKKAPAALELSDAELDLIHGGYARDSELDTGRHRTDDVASGRDVGSAVANVLRDDNDSIRRVSLR